MPGNFLLFSTLLRGYLLFLAFKFPCYPCTSSFLLVSSFLIFLRGFLFDRFRLGLRFLDFCFLLWFLPCFFLWSFVCGLFFLSLRALSRAFLFALLRNLLFLFRSLLPFFLLRAWFPSMLFRGLLTLLYFWGWLLFFLERRLFSFLLFRGCSSHFSFRGPLSFFFVFTLAFWFLFWSALFLRTRLFLDLDNFFNLHFFIFN